MSVAEFDLAPLIEWHKASGRGKPKDPNAGWTIEAMAEDMGITGRTVHRWIEEGATLSVVQADRAASPSTCTR